MTDRGIRGGKEVKAVLTGRSEGYVRREERMDRWKEGSVKE